MKALLLSLVLAVSLTACGAAAPTPSIEPLPEASVQPAELTVCAGTEGTSIDPAYLSESDPADYISHLFEGLMKYAPVTREGVMNELSVTYGLAQAVEISGEGLVYRFTIREDALWSDGVAVTAADFVYGWNRLLSSHTHGAAQLSAVLESVRAESDKVLVATLRAPCPYFLKLCAQVYTAPVRRDVVETYGGDWTAAEHIVVSGAYTIAQWVHDDHILLEKNPLYYDAESVTAEGIRWYFSDSTDRVSCDFTANVSEGGATGRVDKAGLYYLYLNANGIRDWRIRAAMLLALDRAAIAAAVGGGAQPAKGLVPAGISLTDGTAYDPSSSPMLQWLADTYTSYDLTDYAGRCRLALDLYNEAVAAGTWSYGRTLQFRCTDSAVSRTVAAVCRENWLDVLGLTVGERVMAGEDYETMLGTNTFDVAYLNWLPDYDDPLSFLQIMERGGEHNYSAWGDVRYNDLLEQAAVQTADRDALLRQTEEALFEKERFAVCPVFWYGECYTAAEGVTGIAHSPCGGYWFGNAER